MLRILIDQDFDHDILRGLRLRLRGLDGLTALEAGLHRKSDQEILAWAAEQRRVVVTHDRNTMPRFAYDRVRDGVGMAGVFVVSRDLPVGAAISELQILVECSLDGEWDNLVIFLPWSISAAPGG